MCHNATNKTPVYLQYVTASNLQNVAFISFQCNFSYASWGCKTEENWGR